MGAIAIDDQAVRMVLLRQQKLMRQRVLTRADLPRGGTWNMRALVLRQIAHIDDRRHDTLRVQTEEFLNGHARHLQRLQHPRPPPPLAHQKQRKRDQQQHQTPAPEGGEHVQQILNGGAEERAQKDGGAHPDQSAQRVKQNEHRQRRTDGAGQGAGDGSKAGNKFGDQQGLGAPAAVHRCGLANAGIGRQRDAADFPEDRLPVGLARVVPDHIRDQGRADRHDNQQGPAGGIGAFERARHHEDRIGGNRRTELFHQYIEEHDAKAVFADQIHQPIHLTGLLERPRTGSSRSS